MCRLRYCPAIFARAEADPNLRTRSGDHNSLFVHLCFSFDWSIQASVDGSSVPNGFDPALVGHNGQDGQDGFNGSRNVSRTHSLSLSLDGRKGRNVLLSNISFGGHFRPG